MRLYIQKLRIEHFRSIETGEIEFPEKGLVLVQGRNRDTGGSSGAGKSNIFQALAGTLGFSDYSGPEQQGWFFEESPLLQLTVKPADEASAVITRAGAKSSIKGGTTHTGAAAINAELRRLCGGLAPDIVRSLTYLRQDERDSFLSLTSAQKFEFLTTLLPEILKLEKIGERAGAELAKADADIGAVAAKIVAIGPQRERYTTQLKSTERLDEVQHALERNAAEQKRLQGEIWKLRHDEGEVSRQVAANRAEVEKLQVQALEPLNVRLAAAQRLVGEASVLRVEVHPEKAGVLAKQTECAKHLQKELLLDEERRRALEAKRGALVTRKHEIQREVERLQGLEKRLPQLKRELAVLDQNKCPTCTQTWVGSEAALKANTISEEIRNIEAAVGAFLEPMRGDLAAVEKEIVEMQGQPWSPSPLVVKLRGIQEQIVSRLAELDAEVQRTAKEKQRVAIAEANSVLAIVQEEIKVVRQKFASAMEEALAPLKQIPAPKVIMDLEVSLRNAQQAQSRLDREIAELQTLKKTAQRELEALASTEAALVAELGPLQEGRRMSAAISEVLSKQGFLSAIFQEVLDEISSETNAILSQVANTAEVTIGFVTERETNSGTTRREIKAISTVRGHTTSLKSGVSGGMYSAVRLAIQLAVRRVVCRRMGVFPGWLILDEPFNGLGEVEKLTCMEILKLVAAEDLVLVVDHATEFQELFDRTIVVTMEKGISRVEAS